MNNNMLKAFAKNGLEILQWSILVVLYEADKEVLTHEEIRERLDLPTSDHPPPKGAARNALVREILRSSREKHGHVEYVEGERETWKLTPEGINFVKNGLDS